MQSTEQSVGAKHNRELKERSAVLAGYTYFVEKVRTNREEGLPLEEAMDGAIRDCIEGHIPEEFFEKRKDEVKKMTQLDYTWERREQLIRKEEYEEGLNDGMERGRSEEKAEDILKVLGCKGKVSELLQGKIRGEKSMERLKEWFDCALSCGSVEDFAVRTAKYEPIFDVCISGGLENDISYFRSRSGRLDCC